MVLLLEVKETIQESSKTKKPQKNQPEKQLDVNRISPADIFVGEAGSALESGPVCREAPCTGVHQQPPHSHKPRSAPATWEGEGSEGHLQGQASLPQQ